MKYLLHYEYSFEGENGPTSNVYYEEFSSQKEEWLKQKQQFEEDIKCLDT